MDSVHTISSVTALTCAWVLTHGPSKPTGLPFLFLTLWLFWMIVSKHLELGCSLFCLLIQCSQSKLGNFLIIITCFRYVWLLSLLPCFWCKTYFWVVFSTESNRGRIIAICTMSFHRLCLWTLFKYILSDESSNILVISLKMYSFFFYNANELSGKSNGQAMLGKFNLAWGLSYLQTDSKICGLKGHRSRITKSVESLNKIAVVHVIIQCKEEKIAEISNIAKYELCKLGCFA